MDIESFSNINIFFPSPFLFGHVEKKNISIVFLSTPNYILRNTSLHSRIHLTSISTELACISEWSMPIQ
jgi:hypothetical protein